MNKHKRIFKRISNLLLVSLFACLSPAAHSLSDKNKLPDIGTVAASALTIDKDIIMGDVIRRQLRAQAPIVYDPILDEYLSALGSKLVSNAQDVRYPFHFFALKQNSINAFATFGGTIVIHTRTIIEARTEAELASVVAHEIAHVTQRHIARRMEMAERTGPATLASMLGAVLVTLINPAAGVPALMTVQGASQQMQLNYTRKNEKEADRIGLQTLESANFDPRGAENFFGRMAEQTRYSTKLPPMLYSHPLPETRMADIKARVDGLPHRIYPKNPEYDYIRVRTIVRHSQNGAYHAKNYAHKAKSADSLTKPIYQYGHALALMDTQKYEAAEAILIELNNAQPNNLHFVDALTDVYIGLKTYDKAYKMLQNYLTKRPDNQVVVLNYANVLNEGKQYEKAIDILKDYILLYPENHLAWRILADSYKLADMKSQYYQTLAEVTSQRLGYQQAIDQLHTAYNFTPKENAADRKRISGRIKQFRDEISKLEKL